MEEEEKRERERKKERETERLKELHLPMMLNKGQGIHVNLDAN